MTLLHNNSIYLTLPVTIISSIITLLSSLVAIYVIHHFCTPPKEQQDIPPSIKLTITPTNSKQPLGRTTSTSRNDKASTTPPIHRQKSSSLNTPNMVRKPSTESTETRPIRPTPIFRYLSCFIVFFNALNTLFNTIYCAILTAHPQERDEFYVDHPAHIHRITSTVSWYIAKVLFVWMLSLRLYYSFKGSVFRVNKVFIICMNMLNTTVAPIGLSVAYWAVYTQQHPLIIELAFNTGRILYQIIVFIILYMFSKRLLQLVIDKETQQRLFTVDIEKQTEVTKGTETAPDRLERKLSQSAIRVSHDFLELITRDSLLVLTVSFTVGMTTFCFFGFRFIFLPQTSMTLLIPMNMAAIDSLNTSISVVCLFPFGKAFYSKLCALLHKYLKRVCLLCAKKAIA